MCTEMQHLRKYATSHISCKHSFWALVPLDLLIATTLAKHALEIKLFMTEKDELVVKHSSDLYGCVESAKHWYLEISSYLESIGFVKNLINICVFNEMDADGNQVTVVIHVDNLLLVSKREESVYQAIKQLKDKYYDVTVHKGMRIPYIGMVIFDFTRPDKVIRC